MEDYETLVERISGSAGLPKEEIESKVEVKRAKLSGLISKEGAAQIVAAELGISFDNERMKISELVHGMKRVNIVGKITEVFPVREFNKNGREGKIGSFLVGDDSSNARAVLWDVNHISLIENEELKKGDVIELNNCSVRNGELHLSAFSDIKKSNEKMDEVKEKKEFSFVKIKDASPGQSAKLRAFIVQVFEPRYFDDKKNPGVKRALVNLVLDDGSETIRCVLFGETINKLGFSDEEIFDTEKFVAKKNDLLGDEKIFFGNFKTNAYFNNLELGVNDVEELNIGEVIKVLESKA